MRRLRRRSMEPPPSDDLDGLRDHLSALRASEHVVRFLVRPGWVTSVNDCEQHWITARQVMDLNNIDPRECIVIDRSRPETSRAYSQEYLDTLLELRPMTHMYSPVGPAERRAYPIRRSTS